MNFLYNCNDCKYSTNINSNWNRHIKSKSHILIKTTTEEKINDSNKTQFDSIIKFQQEQIELLKKELNEYKQKYENIIEKNDDFQKDIIRGSGKIISDSMNTITFLSLKRQNAPYLETINNKKVNKILTENEYIKKQIENDPKHKATHIVEKLIYEYENDTLCEYFRDIIEKIYKKKNPEEQSFWSTDVQRLVYVIKDIIDNENKWVYDKDGVKIKERIITPIFNNVYELLQKYILKTSDKIDSIYKPLTGTELDIKVKYRIKAINLQKEIKNKKLHKKLLKLIAPIFYLNKKTIKYDNKIKSNINNDSDNSSSFDEFVDSDTTISSTELKRREKIKNKKKYYDSDDYSDSDEGLNRCL
jgi:hypothetical protein